MGRTHVTHLSLVPLISQSVAVSRAPVQEEPEFYFTVAACLFCSDTSI